MRKKLHCMLALLLCLSALVCAGCGQGAGAAKRYAPAAEGTGVDLSGKDASYTETFRAPPAEPGLTYGLVGTPSSSELKAQEGVLSLTYRLDGPYMEGLHISGFGMGQNNCLTVTLTFSLETDFTGDLFLILNGKGPQFVPGDNYDEETGLYTISYEFSDVQTGTGNWLGLVNNDEDSAGKSFAYGFRSVTLKASRLEVVGGQTTNFRAGGDRFFDDFSSKKEGMNYVTQYGQSFVGYVDELDGKALKYSYPNSAYGMRPVLVLNEMTFAPGMKYVVTMDLKVTSDYQPTEFYACLQGSPDLWGGVGLPQTKKVDGVYKIRTTIQNDSAANRRMILYFAYAGETDAVECYIDNLEIVAVEQIYVDEGETKK